MIVFPFLRLGLCSVSFFQFVFSRSSCAETKGMISLPVNTQELVETILYSMDRQKDGYIRLEDLVAGLRSSTSFSLSMYREEFILAGLMVAGFLLYQVQIFTIMHQMHFNFSYGLPGGKAVRSCASYWCVRRPYWNLSFP